MAGALDLPKLPEGQESYAGIPKAVFVVRKISNLIGKSSQIGTFYNQQNVFRSNDFNFSIFVANKCLCCRMMSSSLWPYPKITTRRRKF